MRRVLTILLIGAALSSCTKAIILEEDPNQIEITGPVNYNPDVQDIMFTYCVTCHGGSAPSANLDLTTYQNVKNAAENGTLIQRINSTSNPMPTNGLMPAELRAKMDKWVTDGLPN